MYPLLFAALFGHIRVSLGETLTGTAITTAQFYAYVGADYTPVTETSHHFTRFYAVSDKQFGKIQAPLRT